MNLSNTLDRVLLLLESQGISYALAGGLVANLYRNEMRMTNDIDIAVVSDIEEEDKLQYIMNELGLSFGRIRDGDLKNIPFRRSRSKTLIQIIVGRDPSNPSAIGVDFLLKTLPWVTEAVERAQNNVISVSKRQSPCLTIEDIIISKLYSIRNQARFKDLDDLEQFLKRQDQIDKAYLLGRMQKYELPIPREIRTKFKIDSEMEKVSKEIEKKFAR